MSVVTEHLNSRNIEFEALEHSAAHTALQEALSLGIGADWIAKAVVLDTPQGHAVAVIPANRRVDLKGCIDALGEAAHLASEDEVQEDFPQFEPGAFPAVPSMLDVPFIVDPEVLEHESVIVAGGDPRHSVRVATEELFDDPGVLIAPIARMPDEQPGIRI